MQPARAAWTVVLACAASVLGCDPPVETPWDGSYVAMEERGDWVDTGPLSTCHVLEDSDATTCGSLESFDLSACKRRTLEDLDRQGVFRAELRYEPRGGNATTRAAPAGFKLGWNGAPELVLGAPPVAGTWSARTLYFSSRDGDALRTFVACNAVNERVLTGCFSVCRNGRLEEAATFRAERMSRFQGEAEAGGGMRLLSEAFVAAGRPVDVLVTKGHAFVISESRPGNPGGLTVFDVRGEQAPVAVATLSPEGNADWKNATVLDDTLYVATADSGIAVVDITEPSRPSLVRTVPDGSVRVGSVSVDGARLYATVETPERATLVFDVSSPLVPRLVGNVSLAVAANDGGRLYTGHGSVAREGRLYVNQQQDGFKVADISNPDRASLLGKYTYPYGSSAASAVGTFANRVIAFELGRGLGSRLRVLDASEPASIQKIGEYGLRQVVSPRSLELRGSRLYVAYHQEGLRVLDVSTPTRVREVAWFNTYRETDAGRGDAMEEGATGLHVPGDGRVYVVDTARGLLVLNEPP
ncbi:hypothetical protein JY651_41790 [Pyxidicoccus parkwayensis]|uniref:Lipoprotein n=1 Tax=Pyxidicoccus parkwayensis TaxID=2813578 RepID=A0ABX7NVY6_9BACT|nr:hypothetical protein [Pyxidicoccus parkwaysis]QSQ21637.1 hypothetical protein JY651_41790 [Pyxidicoccus parkwaysis]